MKGFLKNTALLVCFVFLNGLVGQAPKFHSKYMEEQIRKANPELVSCFNEKPPLVCMKLYQDRPPTAIAMERFARDSKWIARSAAGIQWLLIVLFGYLFSCVNDRNKPSKRVSA